ncbi:MAG: Alanine--tRNA ligase [Mycoplasmataceae bacterium]|nr:MAG: Alanine--tRNA ligase [Mycoplasmataceae bacterium]
MKPITKFTTNYVRQSWLDIFQQKNYFLLEPALLIPQNDSSLLWINSGVATLKKYFNNPDSVPNRNLVNCQRVIRTDDLANINSQSYHQTLFEMLGCFSIGGNFKEETIPIIWEWFTSPQWLNINPNNLFITVLPEDKVTQEIWQQQKGVNSNHIIFGTKNSNFWDMGDGPCGPCTEIFYELSGKGVSPEQNLTIEDLDNKRFIEIGNIVFSEFYHKGEEYSPLTQKCVDFGGGLERIAMVLQNKKNAFEIDLWEPVVKLIESYCQSGNSEQKSNYYIITDHLRTTIFALADGAEFESKGRGYILKKLVKKATLLAHSLDLNGEQIEKITEKVIEVNSSWYTHLKIKKELIINELKKEIDKALNFIDKSNRELEKNYRSQIIAEDIFFWYDTKGIPMELIRFHLAKKNHQFPEQEFNQLLDQQKEKGRKDREDKGVSVF